MDNKLIEFLKQEFPPIEGYDLPYTLWSKPILPPTIGYMSEQLRDGKHMNRRIYITLARLS